MFQTITELDRKKSLVKVIIAREHEIENYQVNINNYTAIIAGIADDWNDEFRAYQQNDCLPMDKLLKLNDLVFKDDCKNRLVQEIVQQNISKHVYNAMISQFFDKEELKTLIEDEMNNERN